MTEAETAVREALAKMTLAARDYAAWLLREHLDMRDGCPDADLAELADALDLSMPALLAELDAARAENARLREVIKDAESVVVILVGEVRVLLDQDSGIAKSLTGIKQAQAWHPKARAALEASQ